MIGAAQGQPRASIFAALLCLFVLPHPALGQKQITVRFVDYRSGKPIKNFYLMIEAWTGRRSGAIITKDTSISREKYSKKPDGQVIVRLPPRQSDAKTVIFEASTRVGRDGKLTIYFPETLPDRVGILTDDLWSPATDFDPSEVIRVGEAVPFQPDQISGQARVSPSPGEIMISSKKRTGWDRILQEIP